MDQIITYSFLVDTLCIFKIQCLCGNVTISGLVHHCGQTSTTILCTDMDSFHIFLNILAISSSTVTVAVLWIEMLQQLQECSAMIFGTHIQVTL